MRALFPEQDYSGAGWKLRLESPAPGVLVTVAEGAADGALARRVVEAFDRVHDEAGGMVDAFHDWSGVTRYESEARSELVGVGVKYLSRTRSLHVLQGSRILTMGLAIANLSLGGKIVVHDTRQSFRSALSHVLGERRGGDPAAS